MLCCILSLLVVAWHFTFICTAQVELLFQYTSDNMAQQACSRTALDHQRTGTGTRGTDTVIAHLNVRSLCLQNGNDKMSEVSEFLQESYPSILGLSETWVDEKTVGKHQFTAPGFSVISKPMPACKKKGGGLMLYIREGLDYIDITGSLPKNNSPTTESLVVEFTLKNQQKLAVALIYRAPTKTAKTTEKSVGRIHQISDFLSSKYKNILLFGDFNINLLAPEVRDKLNFLGDKFGFDQTVEGITRPGQTPGSGTLIDHVYHNLGEKHISTAVLPSDEFNTDHSMTWSTFRLAVERVQDPGFITIRDKRYFDREKFREDLGNKNWLQIYLCADVDQGYEVWDELARESIDKFLPKIKIKVSHKKRRVGWMTPQIEELKKEKNKLLRDWKKAVKVGDSPDKVESLHVAFKVCRNRVTALIRKEKGIYISHSIDESNPGNFWKVTKEIMGFTKKSVEPPEYLTPKSFNEYFRDVANDLLKGLPVSDSPPPPKPTLRTQKKFKISRVEESDMMKLVYKILLVFGTNFAIV